MDNIPKIRALCEYGNFSLFMIIEFLNNF